MPMGFSGHRQRRARVPRSCETARWVHAVSASVRTSRAAPSPAGDASPLVSRTVLTYGNAAAIRPALGCRAHATDGHTQPHGGETTMPTPALHTEKPYVAPTPTAAASAPEFPATTSTFSSNAQDNVAAAAAHQRVSSASVVEAVTARSARASVDPAQWLSDQLVRRASGQSELNPYAAVLLHAAGFAPAPR